MKSEMSIFFSKCLTNHLISAAIVIWSNYFLPPRCEKATIPDDSCDSALFKFDKATKQLKCFDIPTEPGDSYKSVTWVAAPIAPTWAFLWWEVVRGVAATKGPMTYASLVSVTIKGMGLKVEIWALRLEYWPWTWVWGFKGRIGTGTWALGLGLRPLSWNLGLEAGILAYRLGLGLRARIWASWLRFWPRG